MKKILAMLLALTMVLAFAACEPATPAGTTTTPTTNPTDKVLTYAEYAAIEVVEGGEQVPVVIEFYVQATQSWWDNKITVYGQDRDGGYFVYEMACSQEDSTKLVPGTKIRVKGFKTVWAGEYELASGATFEFVEGADTYVAEAFDATSLLGTDDLIKHQNKLVTFKGMSVVEISYKGGEPGDDIYVKLSYGDNIYDFCVEKYLTGPDTDLYKSFANINAGDVVDITGFLYWYNTANTHITAINVLQDVG